MFEIGVEWMRGRVVGDEIRVVIVGKKGRWEGNMVLYVNVRKEVNLGLIGVCFFK